MGISKKTVLLTGGTGFLGSNLLKRLILEDYKIILLIRPSSNTWRLHDIIKDVVLYTPDGSSFDKLFQSEHIDIIIHCATNYGRGAIDPSVLLEANLILPLKLLQSGNKNGVSCFINTDTVLDKGVNYYSLSKDQFKEWLKVYSHEMACINIALEHFYGPFDDKSKFVSFIIDNLLNNVDNLDLTEGRQKRDFIYIDDVVDAFVKIIQNIDSHDKGYFHYEIGTSCTIEIREFATLVKRLSHNARTFLNFGSLPYRRNEVMESHVDVSAIRKLGWAPKYSIEEGLRKTIQLEKEYKGR